MSSQVERNSGRNRIANRHAERPIHRLPRQAHHACDGGDRLALGVKLPDQGLLLLGELDARARPPAAPRLALGLRFGDPGQLPFFPDLRFVGGDTRQHPGHQPSGWGAEVEALPETDEADAELLQLIEERQQPLRRPA